MVNSPGRIPVLLLLLLTLTQIHNLQAQTNHPSDEEDTSSSSSLPDYDYDDVNSKARKSEIFNQILDSDEYDTKIRPPGLGVNGSGPVTIKVSMYIRSIENIDDIKMEYTVQLTYRQEWNDPRVKYSHIQRNVRYLQLIKPERIWSPDIFFSNEKTSTMHDLMVPNMYTRIYPNGTVLQSYRITLLLNCPMDLHTYPLDIQICPLRLASYGWSTTDLVLQWREWGPVELAGDFYMARFELKDHFIEDCQSITNSGNYSCIKLYFTFDRQFGFYLIQIYVPCALLVVISWVAFWLDVTAAEARVSLGVTTILAIVTETHGINESVPPASYIKALDVWTAVCQAMVFAALLQFSYVNYMAHFWWTKLAGAVQSRTDEDKAKKDEMVEQLKQLALRKAKRVDHMSQVLFPLSFLIFNIVYWVGYLLVADNTNKKYSAYVYPSSVFRLYKALVTKHYLELEGSVPLCDH